MFFPILTLVMLGVVLVGFAPTFFLRPLFSDTPLSALLIVHGLLQTAWFVVLPAQAWLAKSYNMRLHRRLGWTAAVLAALIVVTSIPVTTQSVPNSLAQGTPELFVAFIVLTNMLRIPFFAILVGAALYYRQHEDFHKRALIIASVSNLAPATARWALMFDANVLLVALASIVPFGIALVVHDRRTRRAVHPMTAWGLIALPTLMLVPIALLFAGARGPLIRALMP